MNVVVDRFELVYHDPENLHSTIDMRHTTVCDAEQQGARPCSHCFNERFQSMCMDQANEIHNLSVDGSHRMQAHEAWDQSTTKPWLNILGWNK